ncbi:unannotated protein [freshwater metagenome]|uniref:methionyl-tRNA formyltransferase n=1 Tax=freshwater metagenome TaxID=449393 RepID=A0A6J7G2E5_9ZZZZ
MRVVFAGTPAVAIPALESILASPHELIGVITREDAPFGRHKRVTPSPVAVWAEDRGIEVARVNRLGPEEAELLAQWQADVGVIVAYGALVREPILSALPHGWLNLHFSHLPDLRGAAPVQNAILRGDTHIATSVFRLVAELDAGDVCDTRAHEISGDETSGEVLARLAVTGGQQLVSVLDAVESGVVSAAPQSGTRSHAPKLSAADGRLRTVNLTGQYDRFRATTPEPGAWVETDAGRLKLVRMRRGTPCPDLAPGTLQLREGELVMVFSEGTLACLRVVPAGKREMSGAEWFRGLRRDVVNIVDS